MHTETRVSYQDGELMVASAWLAFYLMMLVAAVVELVRPTALAMIAYL
jgi:hypothetical protein